MSQVIWHCHFGWALLYLNLMLSSGASEKSVMHSMLSTCCTCAPPSTRGSTGLVWTLSCAPQYVKKHHKTINTNKHTTPARAWDLGRLHPFKHNSNEYVCLLQGTLLQPFSTIWLKIINWPVVLIFITIIFFAAKTAPEFNYSETALHRVFDAASGIYRHV